MATKRVTFRFMSGSTGEPFQYVHTLPARLCVNLDDTSQPRDTIVATATTIFEIGKYYSRETSSLCEMSCASCGHPRTRIINTPMTLLHLVCPSVAIMVSAVCDSETCEKHIREEVLTGMRQMKDMFPMTMPNMLGVDELLKGDREVLRQCEVCEGEEGWKACAACKRVGYCGRECQKEDWKVHKTICKWLSEEGDNRVD